MKLYAGANNNKYNRVLIKHRVHEPLKLVDLVVDNVVHLGVHSRGEALFAGNLIDCCSLGLVWIHRNLLTLA